MARVERIERSLSELEADVLPLNDTRVDEPVGLEPTYDLAVYRICSPAHNLSATAHQTVSRNYRLFTQHSCAKAVEEGAGFEPATV